MHIVAKTFENYFLAKISSRIVEFLTSKARTKNSLIKCHRLDLSLSVSLVPSPLSVLSVRADLTFPSSPGRFPWFPIASLNKFKSRALFW